MPLPSVSDIFKLLKGSLTIEAQEKIMELRQAAMEIQEENLDLRSKIQALEAKVREMVQPSLPPCPSCGERAYSVVKSEADRLMKRVGGIRRQYQCKACQFTETRLET